jgi:aspartate aminotransferase-like enzyme
MAGKLLRIGHLGLVHETDITALLDALRIELSGTGSVRPSVTAG